TERLLNVDLAAHVTKQRFMPVLAIKGKPEVRLGSFQSLAGKPIAGPWAPLVISPAAAPAAAPPPAATAAAVEEAAPVATADLPAPVAEPAPPPAEAVPTAPTAEASSADAELDALLASLSGGDAAPAT